ncbi:prepilin-type N-terminal cleavage/methylation domain-containing protein [Populibacterium corticicola]|uniref:Prepilin-type N-terminal cleavage/methylation domain-containing protein n=1 Tax=Populibacterium corticicola TaxID=1812826 RepID=A0ABW5XEE3_9MICO
MKLKNDESGFGLIEIIVAMVLFSIILMAAAPVMVQSLAQTARNVTMAAATRISDEHITAARANSNSCETFRMFVTERNDKEVALSGDPRANTYHVTVQAWQDGKAITADPDDAACVEEGPPAVLRIKVAWNGDRNPDPVVDVTTLVAIPGVQ